LIMKKTHSVTRPTVMFSFSQPDKSTNPYVTMIARDAAESFSVIFFSWSKAIFSKYDLFHAHWPEYTIRGTTPLKTAFRTIAALIWLFRMFVSRTPVIVTQHNQTSHDELRRLDKWYLHLFEKLVWTRIFLNNSPENHDPHGITIVHGEYRSWYAPNGLPPRSDPQPQISYVGLIRQYKGVESLITAFNDAHISGAQLLIAGKSLDPQYLSSLLQAASVNERISIQPGHVPDDELVSILVNSDLVVLPYKYMYNSGALILALSMDVPVLVPDTPANRAMRDEVGESWIHLFSWPLDKDDLHRAWRAAQEIGPFGPYPNLEDRTWELSSWRHRRLYNALLLARRDSRKRISSDRVTKIVATTDSD
jgi:beta-1,4-mannosyltransferase